MRISMVGSFRVPADEPLATVADNGEIWLWPSGRGNGPIVIFTPIEWSRVVDSVRRAQEGMANGRTQDGG